MHFSALTRPPVNVIIGYQLIFCDEWAKTALNGAQRVCIRCEQMSAFGYPAHEHGKVKCIEPFAACSVPQFSAQKCVTTFEAEWLPFREIRWYSA
jgi:hypothetical protein